MLKETLAMIHDTALFMPGPRTLAWSIVLYSLADKYGYKFIEVSAKTGHNKEQVVS